MPERPDQQTHRPLNAQITERGYQAKESEPIATMTSVPTAIG